MSLDVSAYYIDWKDMQFSLTDALGSTYVANGGTARVRVWKSDRCSS